MPRKTRPHSPGWSVSAIRDAMNSSRWSSNRRAARRKSSVREAAAARAIGAEDATVELVLLHEELGDSVPVSRAPRSMRSTSKRWLMLPCEASSRTILLLVIADRQAVLVEADMPEIEA